MVKKMGKNTKADECKLCGNLIYYGGKNPCSECRFDEAYEQHLEEE